MVLTLTSIVVRVNSRPVRQLHSPKIMSCVSTNAYTRLIAATVGPVANVFSIAALVVYWRMSLVQGGKSQESAWNGDISTLVPELEGTAFQDPHWFDNRSGLTRLIAKML